MKREISKIRCPKAVCGKTMPSTALHCVYCGQELAQLRNLDGQLAIESLAGAPPYAVAIRAGGQQAEIVGDLDAEIRHEIGFKAKIPATQKEETKQLKVEEIIFAIQDGREFVDV